MNLKSLHPLRRQLYVYLFIGLLNVVLLGLLVGVLLSTPSVRSFLAKVEISSGDVLAGEMPFSRNFDVVDCHSLLATPIEVINSEGQESFYLPVALEEIGDASRFLFLRVGEDSDLVDRLTELKQGSLRDVYPTKFSISDLSLIHI